MLATSSYFLKGGLRLFLFFLLLSLSLLQFSSKYQPSQACTPLPCVLPSLPCTLWGRHSTSCRGTGTDVVCPCMCCCCASRQCNIWGVHPVFLLASAALARDIHPFNRHKVGDHSLACEDCGWLPLFFQQVIICQQCAHRLAFLFVSQHEEQIYKIFLACIYHRRIFGFLEEKQCFWWDGFDWPAGVCILLFLGIPCVDSQIVSFSPNVYVDLVNLGNKSIVEIPGLRSEDPHWTQLPS